MNPSSVDRIQEATLPHNVGEQRRVPLVVDLDGTLLKTDLLHEVYLSTIFNGLDHHRAMISALRAGKPAFKAALAAAAAIDYDRLPYDKGVLNFIEMARREGRPVYLATATHRVHADEIAHHLGVFDGVFASDEGINLSGEKKAERLIRAFGAGGFDYVGNDAADLPVWAVARRAYAIRTNQRTARRLASGEVPYEHLGTGEETSARAWLRALRVHQYAKNTLIFVPLLTAHLFSPSALLLACLAFAAFSAVASSVYLVNDLIDIADDRRHPTKHKRPIASGQVTASAAIIVAAFLLCSGFALAIGIGWQFAGVLAVYYGLTTAYSFYFKRKMIIDIVVLAMLYTLRIAAGAVALGVVVSEWLLAFSMLIFTALALVKRLTELLERREADLPDSKSRNYKVIDISVATSLAAAAGFNSVTVFSLYIQSENVRQLYRTPEFLWLIPPLLIYWIARILTMTNRQLLHDDPVVFALRDRNSLITLTLIGCIVLAATVWTI